DETVGLQDRPPDLPPFEKIAAHYRLGCSHSDLCSAYSTSPCSLPSIRSGQAWWTLHTTRMPAFSIPRHHATFTASADASMRPTPLSTSSAVNRRNTKWSVSRKISTTPSCRLSGTMSAMRVLAVPLVVLAAQAFHASSRPLPAPVRADVVASGNWHAGCPVSL